MEGGENQDEMAYRLNKSPIRQHAHVSYLLAQHAVPRSFSLKTYLGHTHPFLISQECILARWQHVDGSMYLRRAGCVA